MRRALLVLGLLVLAGCTPTASPTPSPEPPTVVETPSIEGDAVSASPLETDEWVVAARASDLGFVLAANTADFSIAQFTGTRTADTAERQFRNWVASNVGSGSAPVVLPGPPVVLPLEVTVAADGASAEVVFCEAPAYWAEQDSAALLSGRVSTLSMVREGDRIVLETRGSSSTECDATGAAIGTFDPAPEPLEWVDEADVRPPSARD